jgi:hypothetical protein
MRHDYVEVTVRETAWRASKMSIKVTIRQLQEQLPDLLDRTVQSGEGNGHTPAAVAKDQERRLRAYQKKMERLGPDYWLPPEQQARLIELVEKEDFGETLTRAERRELRQLLKRHEQLLVKRAAALQAMR